MAGSPTAYVGRNAVLPLVSQFAITAGHVVGGAFFIETILVYPGIGLRLYKSIEQRDYTLMQGIVLLLTVSVVVANLLGGVLYAKLDPRIGARGEPTDERRRTLPADHTSRITGPLASLLDFLRLLSKKPLGLVGLIGVVFFVVLAFIVPLFVPYQDAVDVTAIYQPPSGAHPLGTDSSGRDVWNQIIHGGRDILLVGFVAGFFSTLIAVTFGSLAAVAGGKVDALISGAADFWLTIPQIPIIVVLGSILKFNSIWIIAALLALLAWAGLLRQVRAQGRPPRKSAITSKRRARSTSVCSTSSSKRSSRTCAATSSSTSSSR